MHATSDAGHQSVRIILGAGEQRYAGWRATQREDLDLLDSATWEALLAEESVGAFLCENVWEHLTEEEGLAAASLCFRYLKPGGYLRCAVPDGNFRNGAYQELVQVGGDGSPASPAASHKTLYTHTRFRSVFESAGFTTVLLEYCDDQGVFHAIPWSPDHGPVYRSLASDHRNQNGSLGFVSLIVDAVKPHTISHPQHQYRLGTRRPNA